jgi:hypothetical protein
MQDFTKREALEFYSVLVVAFIAFMFVIWYNYTHPRMVVRYDCSIAEISPDYPVAVKEGCRKLRAENNLQKPK